MPILSKDVVALIVKGLRSDAKSFGGAKAESLESISSICSFLFLVAIQCLMEVYGVDDRAVASSSGTLTTNTILGDEKSKAQEFKAKGNEHLAQKRFKEAVDAYSEAIRIDPTCAVYYANRAAAYASLSDHEKSAEDAQRSVEIDPLYAKGWSRLGTSYTILGRHDEAVDAYEEASRLEPTNGQYSASLEAARTSARATRAPFTANTASTPVSTSTQPPSSPSLGGFDMSQLAGLANNPQFMKMAGDLMSSGKLADLMNNPMAQQMMKNFTSKQSSSPRDDAPSGSN